MALGMNDTEQNKPQWMPYTTSTSRNSLRNNNNKSIHRTTAGPYVCQDNIQASANLVASASSTPQGGRQLLAQRQPTSPSEMPPSPPQLPPPAPRAEANGDTDDLLTGALRALLTTFTTQYNPAWWLQPCLEWHGRFTRIASLARKTTGQQTDGSSPL